MNLLKKIIDVEDENSIATKVRQGNFKLFKDLVLSFNRQVKILDIGGTQNYWEMMKYTDPNLIQVTLINIDDKKVTLPNFTAIKMNALDLNIFKFDCDIIFSHSLIEHIDHEKFAYIVKNFNKPYFIQTPNKYFPIEPHFLFPMLQFFPIWLKYWFVRTYRKELESEVETINLLSKKELKKLFPNTQIYGGKILGIAQSFVVINMGAIN